MNQLYTTIAKSLGVLVLFGGLSACDTPTHEDLYKRSLGPNASSVTFEKIVKRGEIDECQLFVTNYQRERILELKGRCNKFDGMIVRYLPGSYKVVGHSELTGKITIE